MKKFIYEEYKTLKAWKVIANHLKKLEKNQDINITTMFDLVTGSIIKQLVENDLLKEEYKIED